MASDQRTVTLRPATAEDESLLLLIYSSTRLDELAMTPWNQAQREAFLKMQFDAQQHHYQTHYPGGICRIIVANEQPVGRLYTAEMENEIRILDITILPKHRSAGIGTPIIEAVMADATKAGKAVSIYVESYNPSHRLFERLGFAESGESGFSHLMVWRPPPESQSP